MPIVADAFTVNPGNSYDRAVWLVMRGPCLVRLLDTEQEARAICKLLNEAWEDGFSVGKYST